MTNKARIAILFLFLIIAHALPVYAADYIIDTDIGGDIDDVLAVLVALNEPVKPIAITTTHIEPLQKARIAKLLVTLSGYADIPVYSGIGTTRDAARELFLQQNPLWPPGFGYPEPLPGEKAWFSQQAVPYEERFGVLFTSMQIENESAPEYIARVAKSYSPKNKLIIVALGPLHNIAAALRIDPAISHNIKIYAMGGVYPKGYNWLVSPATTAPVLAGVETVSVLSSLIETNQFYISAEEFAALDKHARSQLGRAIMEDWKNWYKMGASDFKKTHLSDPVTLYLALHPEVIINMSAQEISLPCLDNDGRLKPEFAGQWYNKPGLENKLMTVKSVAESRAKFVNMVQEPEKIRIRILTAIQKYVS